VYKGFALLLLAGAIQAQQAQVVWAGRGWYQVSNGKSLLLARNGTLNDGDTLNGGKESGDLILKCPRDVVLVYSCTSEKCNAQACKPEKFSGLRVTQISFLLKLPSLLEREPEATAAVLAVRGTNGPGDAVVLQTPQGVHWGPALTRVLEGRYCFRLAHLPNGSGGPREFTLDWDRSVEKEGIAAVPNLAPGLYRFEKGAPAANGACGVDAGSAPAWVLVTPQARFAAIDKQWEEDSAKIDDLEQDGVSTAALTALRHAALATLADSVEGR
jgi:hypothetical protein